MFRDLKKQAQKLIRGSIQRKLKKIAETRTKTFHQIFKLARPRASKLGVLLKTWTTLADHKEKTREKYSHGFSRRLWQIVHVSAPINLKFNSAE
jgi:hypothetical protein